MRMRTELLLSQVVDGLSAARHNSNGACVVDGVSCLRVGRNDVWRVVVNDVVHFVTYCRNDGDFRRRLAGIELVEKIARDHPNVVPPRLESVIDSSRVIVVRKAEGIPAEGLLKRGYRIDRNPFHRRAQWLPFLNALVAITGFLRVVHQHLPSSRIHLWDHGPESVFSRVESHLYRLSQTVDVFKGLTLPPIALPSQVVSGAVLGDLSLGNFLIDGDRVVYVDFEDFGVGEPRRDVVLLNESLKRALAQWHYWADDVDTLVPVVGNEDPWCTLYALELQLQRVWQELERPRPGAGLTREVEAARRQLRLLSRTT